MHLIHTKPLTIHRNMLRKSAKYYFVFVLVAFAIFKSAHISLPYFWDEAWSYFPAISRMVENGPGLLPGTLSLDEGKGHPLFFFFLASSWMSLLPGSLIFARLLPLFISLGLLLYAWHFARKTGGVAAGNLTITLLAVQSLFLAQATFLLPEMLLAFLLLVSFDMYLSKKYALYAVAASLMILTKETALVFALFFLLWHLLSNLDRKREKTIYAADLVLLSVPPLIYGIWLILHYIKFGTFFYSEHIGHMQFEKFFIVMKLKTALSMVFIEYGRWAVSLALMIALFYLVLAGKKIANLRILTMIAIMSALFMAFSSLNFYTQRYMLGTMTMFIIAAGIAVSQIKAGSQITCIVAAGLLATIPLYYSLTLKKNADSDLGFVEVIELHRGMVDFCEKNGWQNEPVSSSFNMSFNLRDTRLGYLSGEGFTQIQDRKELGKARIFITESTAAESAETMDLVKQLFPVKKEFRNKHAFGEIWYKP